MQHQLDKDIRWYCKKDNGKNAKANKPQRGGMIIEKWMMYRNKPQRGEMISCFIE